MMAGEVYFAVHALVPRSNVSTRRSDESEKKSRSIHDEKNVTISISMNGQCNQYTYNERNYRPNAFLILSFINLYIYNSATRNNYTKNSFHLKRVQLLGAAAFRTTGIRDGVWCWRNKS